MYHPSWILKCIPMPVVVILFQNNSFNNNMLWLNEIHVPFPKMFHNEPKKIIPCFYGHFTICVNCDMYTYVHISSYIGNKY